MWGWKHPDLPSVLYPNAQLEPNLVLHVCSTSHAQEISMHCLKKKNNPQNQTPNHCTFSVLLPANNNIVTQLCIIEFANVLLVIAL